MPRLLYPLTFVIAAFCLLPPARLEAGVFSGSIKSVSADDAALVVEFSNGREDLTFEIPKSATITLDGKPARIDALAEGLAVSVFTNSSDDVTRIIARSETTASPKPAPTPKPKASTKGSKSETAGGRGPRGGDGVPGDWPQYGGPNRDNISTDTGLLSQWPADGPRGAWLASGLGEGFSSVAVVNGKVFTMGNVGSDEMIHAFNLQDGEKLWSTRNGPAYREGRGNGPRGTPTVDGSLVFALGGNGDLSCVDADTGKVRWQKNILQEFGGSNIQWGISESPLVDGDRVIVTPGGSRGTVVALNKQSGQVIWASSVPGSRQTAYSSAIVADVGGVKQYINFVDAGVVGVRASDGQPMWLDRNSSNGTANCSSPIFVQNHVFSASGYGTGGALVQLASGGGTTNSQLVYKTSNMKNHHGGMVVVDGFLYGTDDPGIMTCIDLKDGRAVWQDRSVGKGAVVYADGHIYLRSEEGAVALIEATSQAYREKGRFRQPNRSGSSAWPHPVVAHGKLFLRDMDNLLVYDVKR